MKQNPRDFWTTTPVEFWTIWDGFFGIPTGQEPITRSRLKELMEKNPDV